MDSPLMKVPEVAAYLRIKTTTVYKWLERGDLPGFKMGSSWRVHKDSLDKYIENQRGKCDGSQDQRRPF